MCVCVWWGRKHVRVNEKQLKEMRLISVLCSSRPDLSIKIKHVRVQLESCAVVKQHPHLPAYFTDPEPVWSGWDGMWGRLKVKGCKDGRLTRGTFHPGKYSKATSTFIKAEKVQNYKHIFKNFNQCN